MWICRQSTGGLCIYLKQSLESMNMSTVEELHADEQFGRDRVWTEKPFPTLEQPDYHRSIQQCELTVTAPRWTSDGLMAEVSVVDGAEKLTLHRGDLCLTSLHDKDLLARYLKNATDISSWHNEI